MFLEKGILKIYRKFTGEHPRLSVISVKLQSNLICCKIFSTLRKTNDTSLFKKPRKNDSIYNMVPFVLIDKSSTKFALMVCVTVLLEHQITLLESNNRY